MPRSAELLHNTATALDAAGRSSEAIDRWHAALQINPRFDPTNDALTNFAAKAAGSAASHIRGSDFSSAMSAWYAAARAMPARADYHSELGKTFVALGRDSEGQHSFKRALDADPRHGPAYIGLGEIAMGAKEPSSRRMAAMAASGRGVAARFEHGMATVGSCTG